MIEDVRREEEAALPYCDPYGQEEQRTAEALIREEMRTSGDAPPSQPPTTAHDSRWISGTLVEAEVGRASRGEPMKPLDASRYAVSEPVGTDRSSESGWRRAADNARAQAEIQRARLENLELLNVYGANAWVVHVKRLEEISGALQSKLEDSRAAVRQLNAERKAEQIRAQQKLDDLHGQFIAAVAKNAEVESACTELEERIEKLRSKPQQK